MKRRVQRGAIAAALLLAFAAPAVARDTAAAVPATGSVDVYFTPWDDAQTPLLSAVDGARRQILVQAFVLTGRSIADGLIAAHRRGIDVRVLADAQQYARNPVSLQRLVQAGVPVWLETRYRNAHNKVMVIDAGAREPTVITGSYNFTWSAQSANAENLLIMRGNAALAERYANNWKRHQSDAEPLESR